jgi:hypothetical protein
MNGNVRNIFTDHAINAGRSLSSRAAARFADLRRF